MALTAFGTNDAQNVNIWSKKTMREALKKTFIRKFMGNSKTAIIQRLDELEKNAGDTVKYDLLMQATGAGITGDNRLKDNEEAMVYHQDSVVIDQLMPSRPCLYQELTGLMLQKSLVQFSV